MSSTEWQAFAQIRGRVKYLVQVPADTRLEATVFDLDSAADELTTPGDAGGDAAVCQGPPAELRDSELVQCLGELVEELDRRQEPPAS